ncbi:MAG TPA: decarboxylating 6-phosphogluconate dehydrogenase [Nitrospinaceae bacterium]|jgi:6-phosphogluconate dehydrogenase|nr:decarboxylating 6-phosphogluconate dehydrogenase [Nitrospinaceae bacterium]HIN87961.1 decarboxylating 6-phosphogluconate dehydrogenase [Nitrospinaceae bacterium]
MKFGIIGLGRIGGNLSLQAIEKGHQVVGYSLSQKELDSFSQKGMVTVPTVNDLVKKLKPPRIIFIYIPHGDPMDSVTLELMENLESGDIVVDGGNSFWKKSVKRYADFKGQGIQFLDCGTSGGIEGARKGACFMVGGDKAAFLIVKPILHDLSAKDGFIYVGPTGAGHFTKLIHNAIEFGMLQAIGEGVAMLEASDYDINLPELMRNWSNGSVIRSWLIELMGSGLRENKLKTLSPYVEDTREVRWAVEFALEKEVWIPVIAQSELALYRSRDPENISSKAVALMRNGFGGHPLHKK